MKQNQLIFQNLLSYFGRFRYLVLGIVLSCCIFSVNAQNFRNRPKTPNDDLVSFEILTNGKIFHFHFPQNITRYHQKLIGFSDVGNER